MGYARICSTRGVVFNIYILAILNALLAIKLPLVWRGRLITR